MKSILPIAGMLAASITAASATSIVVSTVGVMNTNAHTIIDATGSISNGTFASNMTTAFANNTGGVWDFNSAAFTDLGDAGIAVGDTITLNYGTSAGNSLVMTLGGTNRINQSGAGTGEMTSGAFGLGLGGDASIRTFTLGTPLLTLGVFVGNRGDSNRTSQLTVTYQDTSTASTTLGGANAGPAADSNYFEGLSGTLANPIVSFSLSQSAFLRYDDLGFVAVPEPSSALLLGLVGCGGFIRRRR